VASYDDRVGRPSAIVVDGVFFQHFQDTGIARVWRSYLHEWVKSGFAERIVFLERGGSGPRIPGLPTRSVALWHRSRSANDSLMLQEVCDEEGAALFVSTYYTTPIGTPSLMLVYDLIPERLGFDASDRIWDEKRLAVEHASSYVCISENTRNDLIELEPPARGKQADVVLPGVDETFAPASDEEIAAFRSSHDLSLPYFLVVGERRGFDGYKNVTLLFDAFRAWPAAGDHEIVCVGGQHELEPELRVAAPRARARRLSLGDDELRLAYSGAEALVFPSRYEGFGLPVAEAMACGCPVITTPLASLPEVAGDAAIYVDPDDPVDLRCALDAVREPERRAAMIAAGTARARELDWRSSATAFASQMTAAASADTAAQRRAREDAWNERRCGRARKEPARPPRLSAHVAKLRTHAVRHLPPRVAAPLRALRASIRRRVGRLRRSFAR